MAMLRFIVSQIVRLWTEACWGVGKAFLMADFYFYSTPLDCEDTYLSVREWSLLGEEEFVPIGMDRGGWEEAWIPVFFILILPFSIMEGNRNCTYKWMGWWSFRRDITF